MDSYAVKFGRYEVHYSTKPDFDISDQTLFTKIKIIEDTIRAVNVLREQTRYYFKVRVYNILEKYAESNIIDAKTSFKPPDTIYLKQPVQVTDTTVTLYWSRSTQTSAWRFARYEVYMNTTGKFTTYLSEDLKGFIQDQNTTSITIRNLTPHEEYFVKILNRDSYWNFSESNAWYFCANHGGDPVPSVFLEPEIGKHEVTLNWTKSPSRFYVGYEVYKSLYSSFTPDGLLTGVGTTNNTYYTVKNLKKNTTYYFKVVTYVNDRYGISEELEVKTLP